MQTYIELLRVRMVCTVLGVNIITILNKIIMIYDQNNLNKFEILF